MSTTKTLTVPCLFDGLVRRAGKDPVRELMRAECQVPVVEVTAQEAPVVVATTKLDSRDCHFEEVRYFDGRFWRSVASSNPDWRGLPWYDFERKAVRGMGPGSIGQAATATVMATVSTSDLREYPKRAELHDPEFGDEVLQHNEGLASRAFRSLEYMAVTIGNAQYVWEPCEMPMYRVSMIPGCCGDSDHISIDVVYGPTSAIDNRRHFSLLERHKLWDAVVDLEEEFDIRDEDPARMRVNVNITPFGTLILSGKVRPNCAANNQPELLGCHI